MCTIASAVLLPSAVPKNTRTDSANVGSMFHMKHICVLAPGNANDHHRKTHCSQRGFEPAITRKMPCTMWCQLYFGTRQFPRPWHPVVEPDRRVASFARPVLRVCAALPQRRQASHRRAIGEKRPVDHQRRRLRRCEEGEKAKEGEFLWDRVPSTSLEG